jgi:hypothetical protein
MERRKFIKTAGEAALITPVIPLITGSQSAGKSVRSVKNSGAFKSSVQVKGDTIVVNTSTLTATLKKGLLTSLKSRLTGEEFITSFDNGSSAALQILYPSSELVDISSDDFGRLTLNQVSDRKAEFIVHSWNGDGIIAVSSDDETGDLIIEPSAYSSRPGVIACRWNMPGIRHDLELVAPLFQGIKLKLDDSLIRNSRWNWPMSWEAGLAILQSSSGGFYVHTEDTEYRYKALNTGTATDPFLLGFNTEAYGPIDNNLAAGGLSWRINVHKGDWHVPAGRYREWLWYAYELIKEEEKRKPWIFDVKLAISWCPGDPAILDALAKKTDPSKVLLHFPDWRTDIYDQNYPTYTASADARNFIQKGMKMGFHIMPHCNSVDMDPSNPAYTWIRDFQYRHIETKKLQGWSWVDGKVLGVPESNQSRLEHRDKNVMIKVHPGLSMWRSILGENIAKAGTDLNLDAVFIDVTLVTQNLHNCLVESMTSTEGMKKLISHICSLNNGLVVGGEGLNEITMQGLSFAQAHLFKSWQTSIDGLERTGGCDLNHFLFGKLARTIGYSGLSGKNKDEELRMQIHLDHGAIPTITIGTAAEISNPNPGIKHLLDLANS